DRHVMLPARHKWLITCHSGLIWVTQEGCLDDWVLRAGESTQLHDKPVLVGALRPTELQLLPSSPAFATPVAAFGALASLLARRLLKGSGVSFTLAGPGAIPVEPEQAGRAPRPDRRW